MGKSSRKNKIWRGLVKKEELQKEKGNSSSNELKNKMESRKRGNRKMMKKIEEEYEKLYYDEFKHTTDEISDKELNVEEQVNNFVKNVKFWENNLNLFDISKQLTPLEINKRVYCIQAKKHLMKQLPSFPEAIQKKIMGDMIKD